MSSNIIIRKCNSEDAEAVRAICVETSSGILQKPEMRHFLLTAFCNPYIAHEAENCFVAEDEATGTVAGYILCAEKTEDFAEMYQREYVQKETDKYIKKALAGILDTTLAYAKEYPAHLHIDLSPQYQHRGVGTQLMDALVRHLRHKGIKGMMLCVASNNEKGISFYNKYGFRMLEKREQEAVMGLML